MVESETLWLLFKGNKPGDLGLAPATTYEKKFTPLVEVKPLTPSKLFEVTGWDNKKMIDALAAFFTDLVQSKKYYPGRYGDWIKCTKITIDKKIFLNVDAIGPGAWNKPTLAADLGIFVKSREKVFYVGIIRKGDPGKGLPAHAGGILEAGKELDSAAYTALKEVEEEVNFKIEYQGDLEKLRVDHEIQVLPVSIDGFGVLDPKLKNLKGEIHHVAMIPTPEVERNADGLKRVYATTAFAFLIDCGDVVVTEKDLQKVFTAGDDAGAMFIGDVTESFTAVKGKDMDFPQIPNFGLSHHVGLFIEMVRKLRQTYPKKFGAAAKPGKKTTTKKTTKTA
jgi:8-oxo-dGTP pyrophosphatase MutT (NUDIX family)